MVGLSKSYLECDSFHLSGMAHEIPQSEGGCNGASLNVGIDIVGEKPTYSGHGPPNAREVVRYIHWVKYSSYITLHRMAVMTSDLI